MSVNCEQTMMTSENVCTEIHNLLELGSEPQRMLQGQIRLKCSFRKLDSRYTAFMELENQLR